MDESTDLIEKIPATIGRYQIQDCVGFGAMGAVYRAFDPVIKRTLAIKTIRLDIPRNSPQYDSFIKRFYHEARISGTLNHPNIVTLFDIGEEGGSPFLAMEYVAGETIASIIDRGERFDAERVVGLISQVAAAVDYAHSKDVVHRDIKPSNLILSEGDRVKVTDFGIAKLADTEMTQSGVLLGTPSYMSPEQAMGEDLDGRSDIFSLGVCAFEMLSGEQPFPGPNVTSILYKLVHVDPIEPSELELHGLVPQKWHEVFNKVLAKRPDDRYQTAAEFVQDLEYCLGSWFGAAMGDGPAGAAYLPATEVLRAPDSPSSAAAPPEEDVPKTILLKAQGELRAAEPEGHPRPSESPAPPAASEAPEADEEPATVILSAPPAPEAEETPATVLMAAVAVPDAAPEPPEVGATVVLSAAAAQTPETATLPRPAVAAPGTPVPRSTATPPPLPTAPVTRPGLTPIPKGAARPGGASVRGPRSGVPLPLILVAGVLFLAALVVVALVVVRLRSASPGAAEASGSPVPTPTIETGSAQLKQGFLNVTTEPEGAIVAVNGEPRGAAPLELGLPFGLYDVQISREGFVPQARTVEITATKPISELKVHLEAEVVARTASADIVSTPAGATVLVDGREVGRTPVKGFDLAVGERRIEVQKDGYAPERRAVRVKGGQPVTVRVTLSRVAPPVTTAPVAEVEPVDVNRVYLPREVDQKRRCRASILKPPAWGS